MRDVCLPGLKEHGIIVFEEGANNQIHRGGCPPVLTYSNCSFEIRPDCLIPLKLGLPVSSRSGHQILAFTANEDFSFVGLQQLPRAYVVP